MTKKELKKHIKWMRLTKIYGDLFSSCATRKVGAIITTKDNRILSTGYNGTSRGMKNCNEGGCLRCNDKDVKTGEKLEHCFCIHAEKNAIINAGYCGVSLKHSTLYVPLNCCITCAVEVANSGIDTIFFEEIYPSSLQETVKLFSIVGIDYYQLDTKEEKLYFYSPYEYLKTLCELKN